MAKISKSGVQGKQIYLNRSFAAGLRYNGGNTNPEGINKILSNIDTTRVTESLRPRKPYYSCMIGAESQPRFLSRYSSQFQSLVSEEVFYFEALNVIDERIYNSDESVSIEPSVGIGVEVRELNSSNLIQPHSYNLQGSNFRGAFEINDEYIDPVALADGFLNVPYTELLDPTDIEQDTYLIEIDPSISEFIGFEVIGDQDFPVVTIPHIFTQPATVSISQVASDLDVDSSNLRIEVLRNFKDTTVQGFKKLVNKWQTTNMTHLDGILFIGRVMDVSTGEVIYKGQMSVYRDIDLGFVVNTYAKAYEPTLEESLNSGFNILQPTILPDSNTAGAVNIFEGAFLVDNLVSRIYSGIEINRRYYIKPIVTYSDVDSAIKVEVYNESTNTFEALSTDNLLNEVGTTGFYEWDPSVGDLISFITTTLPADNYLRLKIGFATVNGSEVSNEVYTYVGPFPIGKNVSTTFEEANQDSSAQTKIAYHNQRSILYGKSSVIYLSDVANERYYPYPNQSIDFGEQVVYVHSHNDQLVVFCAASIFIVSEDPELGIFNVKKSQSGFTIEDIDQDLVQTIGDKLFFLSNGRGYFLNPSVYKEGANEMFLTEVTEPISGLVDEIVQHCYTRYTDDYVQEATTDVPVIVLESHVYVQELIIFASIMFDLSKPNNFLTVGLKYDSIQGVWKSLDETSIAGFPQGSEVIEGIYGIQTLMSNHPYLDNGTTVLIQSNVEELQQLDYIRADVGSQFVSGNVFDYYKIPLVADVDGGIEKSADNRSKIEQVKHAIIVHIDSGEIEIDSIKTKRFSRGSIQINNTDAINTPLSVEFIVDGVVRQSPSQTRLVRDGDKSSAMYGSWETVDVREAQHVIPGAIQFNDWLLGLNRFTKAENLVVEFPINGRGRHARIKFSIASYGNFEILNYTITYKDKGVK